MLLLLLACNGEDPTAKPTQAETIHDLFETPPHPVSAPTEANNQVAHFFSGALEIGCSYECALTVTPNGNDWQYVLMNPAVTTPGEPAILEFAMPLNDFRTSVADLSCTVQTPCVYKSGMGPEESVMIAIEQRAVTPPATDLWIFHANGVLERKRGLTATFEVKPH